MALKPKVIEDSAADLEDGNRYVVLALRLQLWRRDETTGKATPAEVLPDLIGGLWDRFRGDWVRPTPAWVREQAPIFLVQEQQLPIVLGLPRSVKFVAVFAGRQAGKTYIALLALLCDALRWPGLKSAFVSLDYKASREPETAWMALLAQCPGWGIKHVKSDRSWRFPNGHEVVFRSEEAINSLRGPSLKTVIPDEAAFMQEASFNLLVGSGLASANFRAILPTTPNRESEWIRKIDSTWGLPEQQATKRIIRLETLKNPKVDPALYDVLVEDMPADVADAELRGILGPPAGATYAGVFRRAWHVRPLGQLPEQVRFVLEGDPEDVTREVTRREFGAEAAYVAGWDFQKEAVALGKILRDVRWAREGKQAVKVITERLWFVDELVDFHATTDQQAQRVVDRWGIDICIVHDAMGRHAGVGGRGDETAAAEILMDYRFRAVVPVARSNPRVTNRVRTVQRALRAAKKTVLWPDGEMRVFVAADRRGLPCCPKLVDAFENQKSINGQPEKDGKHEHIADAAGYLIYFLMPITVAPAGMSRPFAKGG